MTFEIEQDHSSGLEYSSAQDRSIEPSYLGTWGTQTVSELAWAVMHILLRLFQENLFGTLLKLKLFRLLSINTSLLTPWGLGIIKWLKRNHLFSKEDFLERKLKMSHHSQLLIQGLDIWILVWRLLSLQRD